VTLTVPENQTVGDSLELTCNANGMRGIISRVDIIWRRGNMVLNRTINASLTMMDSSPIYTDTYTISQLSTDNDGREYECEVVINSTPQVIANDTVSLDVTGKYTYTFPNI